MSFEDLSLYSLFPATQDQITEARERGHAEWGRGVSVDEYLARESLLDSGEHARDGKHIAWVLAPRENPTSLDFKCFCETYKRISIVKKGSESPHEAISYGITSVYTPPRSQRKGYAHRMMSLLHWVLAPHNSLPTFPDSWGSPPPERLGFNNAQFSVLYSDIGPRYYASTGPAPDTDGWIVRDAFSTIWNVPKDTPAVQRSSSSVKWLKLDDCAEVIERDSALMLDSIPLNGKRVAFATLPKFGVARLMPLRTEIFHSGQSYSLPVKWGVEILSEAGSDTPLSFATWALDVRPPPLTLIATRIRATKKTFPLILSSMLAAARESDVERVEAWNLPRELEELAHSLGGKTEERDEHLSAFKWYGPERNEDVSWAYNEKFCWC